MASESKRSGAPGQPPRPRPTVALTRGPAQSHRLQPTAAPVAVSVRTPKPAATPASEAPAQAAAPAPAKPIQATAAKPVAPVKAAAPAAASAPAAAKPVESAPTPTAPASQATNAPTSTPAPNPATATATPAPAAKAVPAPSAKSAPSQPPAPSPQAPAGFELPAAIYSPQLVEAVMYDIERYLEWYRQSAIQKKVGSKPQEEPTHSAETVLVIEAWLAGKPATLESIDALLEYLRHLNMPEVHIMLAALPNRSQRETLVSWIRSNVSPHLLVSFVADRNLGGGLVVRTPNRVFDFTWKQQLVAGRGKLAEILRRV